jgi:hypothetical protein
MRLLPTVCVVTFLAGCASQPASTPTAVTIPAADAARMAVLNPAMASVTAVALEPSTAVVTKASVPPGYKSVERDGTTFFCTKVASLGTKFKREFCMTQLEYDEMQRRNEGMRQDLRKSVGICSGGSGAFACKGGDG